MNTHSRIAALLCLALPTAAAAQEPPAAAPAELELPPIVVQSRAFEAARNAIAPALGASRYEIDRTAIATLPQGENARLTDVLLQAPGVVQEAFGDLHVRGDHRNLQYRLNGVLLPEAISGFSQLFDARALRSVSLITGALPAQFGYRTAGIVDMVLRSGIEDTGGAVSLYGGSFGTIQPGFNYGGLAGNVEYFASLSGLASDRGFENPTRGPDGTHNQTLQGRGLVHVAVPVGDSTRLSFIAGTVQARYQVPNTPGLVPGFTAFGQPAFDSADLRAKQVQRSSFAILAAQHATGEVDLQLSTFLRSSSVRYRPDGLGDILFDGFASAVRRESLAYGLQGDAAWRVDENHTLRGGLFLSADTTRNATDSTVLPLDGMGGTIDAPFGIRERSRAEQQLYGLYAQDEWRLAETLTLNYGARFDVVAGTLEASQLSPRANLVWRPDEATTIALGYANYFTPPPAELLGRVDLPRYLGTTLQPSTLRADPVKAERSHYLNLGIRRQFGETLTLGVEAYARTVRDMQDLGQFGRAYIFSPYNYAKGRAYGVEFTADWREGPWRLYGNLSISRSEGKGLVSNQYFWTEAELAQVQRKWVRTDHDQLITGSAGASYEAWEGGAISASLVYGSGMRRGFANSRVMTPYATVNLGFSQRLSLPDGGDWTFRLDVLNLFDRTYLLRDGTGIGVGAPQYGMRRGIFAGISRAI
ncbi:TonB-dependent receptor [Siccirubricoccus sp. KC 17139]|uniref:TonB-dependent receptor n=1 Tax=Siccirubricoccus soli TaxID=2899147 RepID=A0ABT1CY48_9PROT|nr:TonB-dependent receptor [Siccirubricoccus soli]MCO6414589.1 TonB-dependent receptor [Siccirubricoccus soli]MCP2680719.1 TonB-dependent receptor [Siccirubricoccus soli]